MHAVGDIVWARDVCGDYYKARVVAGRGDGEARELCVHFFGWAAKFDEWVAADSDGLQSWPGNGQPLSEPAEYEWACSKGRLDDEDAQYEVDSLLRKRSRGDGDAADEYLVRFVGYSKKYDQWLPAGEIDPALVAAFVPPPPKQSRREPLGPYVLSVADPVEPAVAAVLVKPWLSTVGRKAAGLLRRQQDAWACKLLERMDTCPAWTFKALHTAIKEMAAGLTGVCLAPRSCSPPTP